MVGSSLENIEVYFSLKFALFVSGFYFDDGTLLLDSILGIFLDF